MLCVAVMTPPSLATWVRSLCAIGSCLLPLVVSGCGDDAGPTASRDASTPHDDRDAHVTMDAGGAQGDANTVEVTDTRDAELAGHERDASRSMDADAAPPDAGAIVKVVGPCDIYEAGNTPCVAAHSTVRALFGAYAGNLYQVRRGSDKKTKDIGVLSPGGYADAASQDAFCAGAACTISIIYDQTERHNHLTSAPAGGYKKTPDDEVNATAFKLRINGHAAYGIKIDVGTGYRNDETSGVAKGDEPEAEYMVTSAKYYNGSCCFDYGNAETTNNDDGNGTMEAIYFGDATNWGKGAGAGPWVMADLENGLFAGATFDANPMNTSLKSDFVTAMIKGRPHGFALKGGDAQAGALKTMYDGARPTNGYDPMKKQGTIILGIGGDNSNGAVGLFFEGAMTAGYPSDTIDDAIQANIVEARYGK